MKDSKIHFVINAHLATKLASYKSGFFMTGYVLIE